MRKIFKAFKKGGFPVGLHQRLLLWLLILLGALWVVLWANHYSQADKSARQNIDDRLRSAAMLIIQLHYDHDQKVGAAPLPDTPDSDDDRARRAPPAFELLDRSRQPIARSDNFPDTPVTNTPGFESRQIDGETWRLYTIIQAQGELILRVAFTQHTQEATSRSLKRDFGSPLLWLLPGLALAALLSVWQGLAPLRQLTERISRIDAEDPKPLALTARDVPRELQPLLHTLNDLLRQIRDLYARQRAFTASAAHELRTPLAGCLAQLRLAQHGRDAPMRARALERMRDSIEHMTQLIRRMLLLAQLDRAGQGIDTQPASLNALITDVVARHEQTARNAGIRLETRLPRETIMLEGEPTLLDAMLTNPLDNALRVSQSSDRVLVTLERIGHNALVTVQDQGEGIPPQERARVFDPFHQGQNASSSGSGLGLAITHAIVSAHEGTILIRDNDTRGTVIEIRLPCQP